MSYTSNRRDMQSRDVTLETASYCFWYRKKVSDTMPRWAEDLRSPTRNLACTPSRGVPRKTDRLWSALTHYSGGRRSATWRDIMSHRVMSHEVCNGRGRPRGGLAFRPQVATLASGRRLKVKLTSHDTRGCHFTSPGVTCSNVTSCRLTRHCSQWWQAHYHHALRRSGRVTLSKDPIERLAVEKIANLRPCPGKATSCADRAAWDGPDERRRSRRSYARRIPTYAHRNCGPQAQPARREPGQIGRWIAWSAHRRR